MFISNTCTKFVLLHTYFTKQKIYESMYIIIVQPVYRLSWAKCFVTSGVESTQIEL